MNRKQNMHKSYNTPMYICKFAIAVIFVVLFGLAIADTIISIFR